VLPQLGGMRASIFCCTQDSRRIAMLQSTAGMATSARSSSAQGCCISKIEAACKHMLTSVRILPADG
jgi:hypothetical protein